MTPGEIKDLCEHLKASRDALIKARDLIMDKGELGNAVSPTDIIGILHSRIIMLGGMP